jgi:hypothetical protein
MDVDGVVTHGWEQIEICGGAIEERREPLGAETREMLSGYREINAIRIQGEPLVGALREY